LFGQSGDDQLYLGTGDTGFGGIGNDEIYLSGNTGTATGNMGEDFFKASFRDADGGDFVITDFQVFQDGFVITAGNNPDDSIGYDLGSLVNGFGTDPFGFNEQGFHRFDALKAEPGLGGTVTFEGVTRDILPIDLP
jgi:hypothetical protein